MQKVYTQEKRKERKFTFINVSVSTASMAKYLRQSTHKEKRLILVCSSDCFRAWTAVVRQHSVAGAYGRAEPFFSK